MYFVILSRNKIRIKNTSQLAYETGHFRPASEMPFKWHFASGQIVAGRLQDLNCYVRPTNAKVHDQQVYPRFFIELIKKMKEI